MQKTVRLGDRVLPSSKFVGCIIDCRLIYTVVIGPRLNIFNLTNIIYTIIPTTNSPATFLGILVPYIGLMYAYQSDGVFCTAAVDSRKKICVHIVCWLLGGVSP